VGVDSPISASDPMLLIRRNQRLTSSQMGVDTHIPSRSTQTLSLSVRDMLFGFRIPVLFRHSEIDDMNDVGHLGSRSTDQKVIGFDISID